MALECNDAALDCFEWQDHSAAAAERGDEQLHFSFPAVVGGVGEGGARAEPHGIAGGVAFTDQHMYILNDAKGVEAAEEVMNVIDVKVAEEHQIICFESSDGTRWFVKPTGEMNAGNVAELYSEHLLPLEAEALDVAEECADCSDEFLGLLGIAAVVKDEASRPASPKTQVELLEEQRAARRAEQDELLSAESPRYKKKAHIPADASFGTLAKLAQAAQEARERGEDPLAAHAAQEPPEAAADAEAAAKEEADAAMRRAEEEAAEAVAEKERQAAAAAAAKAEEKAAAERQRQEAAAQEAAAEERAAAAKRREEAAAAEAARVEEEEAARKFEEERAAAEAGMALQLAAAAALEDEKKKKAEAARRREEAAAEEQRQAAAAAERAKAEEAVAAERAAKAEEAAALLAAERQAELDRAADVAREKIERSTATQDMGRVIDLLVLPETDVAADGGGKESYAQLTPDAGAAEAYTAVTPARRPSASASASASVVHRSPGSTAQVQPHRHGAGADILGAEGATAPAEGSPGPSESPPRNRGVQQPQGELVEAPSAAGPDLRWSGHRVTLTGNGPPGGPAVTPARHGDGGVRSPPRSHVLLDEVDRVIQEVQAKHPYANGYNSPHRERSVGAAAGMRGEPTGESIHGSPPRGEAPAPRDGESLSMLQGQGAEASPGRPRVPGSRQASASAQTPHDTIQRLKGRFANAPSPSPPRASTAQKPQQRFSRGFAASAPRRSPDGLLARLAAKRHNAVARGDEDEVRRLDLVLAAVEGVHVGAAREEAPKYPAAQPPRAHDIVGLKERASQWLDGLSQRSGMRSPSQGLPSSTRQTSQDASRRLLLYRKRKQRSRSADPAAPLPPY